MSALSTTRSADPQCLTVDLHTAARWFGVSPDSAYDMVRAGTFPVPPIRLGPKGKLIRFARAKLEALLGPLPDNS